VLAVGAPASAAGPPGTWTRVSAANGEAGDLFGVARTSDGVLHVVWPRREDAGTGGVWHTPISPAAAVGEANPVVSGWGAIGAVDLIRTTDGTLRVFFGGLQSPRSANQGLNTASAPASGVGWSLQSGRVARETHVYARSVSSALGRDGTPVTVWDGLRGEAGYHFGTDIGGPEFTYVDNLSSETCGCPVKPGVAVDSATGEVVIGWSSLITGLQGTYAQSISTSGPGSPSRAPGSERLESDQRIGVTARIGAPGVYLGYLNGSPVTGVRLWRYGSSDPVFTIAAPSATLASAAASSEGRIWLMWERNGRLYFTRTNKAATRHGDVVSVAAPAGTTRVQRMAGEGTPGPLDVLAHVTSGGSSSTWHTRVLPPIDVSAPKTVTVPAGAGGKAAVTVRVTDAGDPVAGARVTLAGQTRTTNARGVARFNIARGGTFRAVAQHAGYRRDTAPVKARKKPKPKRR
jgi:hypothetical protein